VIALGFHPFDSFVDGKQRNAVGMISGGIDRGKEIPLWMMGVWIVVAEIDSACRVGIFDILVRYFAW
jgi:hypothetical protein